jgi:N-acetylglucosamine-6-phosphate deacetylase
MVLTLAPGLIDLQIYGSGGKLFAGKPEEDALEQMENDLLSQGTTGFFATMVPIQ